MSNTVNLSASSDYNTAGKQHVARVTGTSSKWGFALEFCGRRSGKRNDVTTATITVPGVYVEHDTTRKGVTDTYYLVWRDGADLAVQDITDDLAAELAGQMDERGVDGVDYAVAGRADMIAWHEKKLAESLALDPDAEVELKVTIGALTPGRRRRTELIAARRAELERLRGPAARDLDLAGGPTDPDHRARRRAELEAVRLNLARQLADVDAQLAELA